MVRTVCSTCSGAITTRSTLPGPLKCRRRFRAPSRIFIRHLDGLVGRTMAKCAGTDTLLMVLSDHGFTTFRRGIDLNRWLEENGYLVVDEARRGDDYLAGVDWTKTRAFAIGLTGIFINRQDKFAHGIVLPEEAGVLRQEIAREAGDAG